VDGEKRGQSKGRKGNMRKKEKREGKHEG
jgi:hypothetical protein